MTNRHKVDLKRFQEEFNALDTTHEKIAQILKCDTSTVTKHYNGKLKISVDYLYKYSELFGVSTDYLLGKSIARTGNPNIACICDMLGLQEETIQQLKMVRQYDPDNCVNEVIKNLISRSLIIRIQEYKNKTKEAYDAVLEHMENTQRVIDFMDKQGHNEGVIKKRRFFLSLTDQYEDILRAYFNINNKIEAKEIGEYHLQLIFSSFIREISKYDVREVYMKSRELAEVADKRISEIRGKEINAFRLAENLCNYTFEEGYPTSDPWRFDDGDY